MGWIRCKLSFALVRSAIMCICGARSQLHSPVFDAPLDVQVAEAHLYDTVVSPYTLVLLFF